MLPAALAFLLLFFAVLLQGERHLYWTFMGAAIAVSGWTGALFAQARATGRRLQLAVSIRSPHWVQACAQTTLILYWGWHIRFVYAFLPLIVAQLVFAYAVDVLLNWTRRDTYYFGFGPMPVILSINLFLWFKPQWFYWQLVMIALGFLAKELIKWKRDGRLAHIFNPSSFPLAVFSFALILSHSSDMTFGQVIANTQFDAPHIYLVIFLASLPGMLLFGVARTTLAAAATMLLIGFVYLKVTGTYLFYDAFIPVPVFLGLHLIITDPSTSPRSDSGRVLFGVLYGLAATVLYVVLTPLGVPTFYDKLLPVPFLNLSVRAIDRLAAARPLTVLDPARWMAGLSSQRRGVAFAGAWAVLFLSLSSIQAFGDRHPGQYLPFWNHACEMGSERACHYSEYLTYAYCQNGSGWACNESGVQAVERGDDPRALFAHGCELGYDPACANAGRRTGDVAFLARGDPAPADLPVILRGTKPVVTDRNPAHLAALACDEGWQWASCGTSGEG